MATRPTDVAREALITGDELLAMGDIGPCELVEGRIVPIKPTGFEHGHYEGNFFEHLKTFVKQRRPGRVVVGEVGIYTRRNPDTVRGVDAAFISYERLAQRQKKRGFLDVAPELIVEILSPDDPWSEVTQKLREYFAIGVKLVWIADPVSRTVYVYRALTDVREFGEADHLTDDDVLPGFSVPVAQLFED
ncbi:MAG: Uma2 family endonuclease [Anaerolineales bacterium]|nr:Uma2 family endonuclease [Anaerolineales bacterium]